MAKVLVYSDDAALAAELAAFSTSVPHEISVLTLDEDIDPALLECGAACILHAQCDGIPEAYARSLSEYIQNQGFSLFIVGATSRGRDIAAQVAGYMECGLGCDVFNLSFDGQTIAYDRSIYGGIAVSSEVIDGIGVVTVNRGTFEGTNGSVESIREITLSYDERMTLVSREARASEGVDISCAERIVGVGMGLSSQDELALAEDIAHSLSGAIGCSRGVAEERGWVPASCYIGISGKVVAPKLYLALGISGQVQHLYGVRDAKIIAAVDKNEKAPICSHADYYIVGDIREYAPLIAAELNAR